VTAGSAVTGRRAVSGAGPRGPVDPRLLRHARPARRGIAAVAAVEVLAALLLVVQAFALADLVVALTRGPERASGARDALLLLAATTAGRAVAAWTGTWLAQRTASAVRRDLTLRLAQRALDLGPAWTERFGTARLTALLTQGLPALDAWFTRYLPALVPGALLPPLVVVLLVVLDPGSALTVALTLPLVPLFAVLLGRATQARADAQWRATRTLSAHFLDVVRGLATLRAHRRAGRQVAAVAASTDASRRATLSVLRVAFLSSTALELVGTLSVGLVAVTAGLRLAAGDLDLRTALLVILLAPEAYRPLREVGARFHDSADAGAVVADVDAVLGARAPATGGGTADGLSLRGVRVERADGSAVLAGADGAGLDLDVAPGRLTAVAGVSGAGKTTLARIAAGVLVPTAGEVRHPLAPGAVAHLPQRPTFPHATTVAEAVAAGRSVPAATVRAVLDEAAADDLDPATPLGEAGSGLSAGQRQRVALARTLLAVRLGARRAVLDEPTAHLDPAAEVRVVARLRRLAHEDGCAVLVVAHRPALLAAADRTLVLTRPPAPAAPPVVPVVPAVPVGPVGPVGPVVTAVSAPVPTVVEVAPAPPVAGARRARGGLAVAAGAGALLAGTALTATATWLLVTASGRPPVLTLSVAAVVVRASAIARPLLGYGERLLAHDVAFARLARWRSGVVAALVPRLPGPLSRRRGGRSGEVLTQLVDDVDARLDGLLRGRQPVRVAVAALLVALAAAVVADPRLALAAVPGLLLAAVAAPAVAARAEDRLEAHRDRVSALAQACAETATGVEDLGTRPNGALDAVRRSVDGVTATERGRARAAATTAVLQVLGSGLVALGVGAVAAATGSGTGADAAWPAAAVLAGVVVADATRGLPDAARARRRARRARQRTAALLATPVPAREPTTPLPLPPPGPTPPRLSLRGVVAGWEPDEDVLRGLDLDLHPGEVVALRGPSGSGKSTLAAVLLRFLDVRGGQVLLDGVATPRLAGDDVRSLVGLVGDDEHVFATTLRENLRLAAPASSDDDLRQALHRVRLDDWAASLPAGLDSRLGDGGEPVSGGERRRLALARALLGDVRVLVLDEPTEGLDEDTAAALVADLLAAAREGHRRSVLLLAHREEGVALADRVVDLVAGRTAPAGDLSRSA